MRKIILLAVAVVFSFTTMNAQENEGLKGAWWGMGMLEYSSTEDVGSSFGVMPVVGTFIAPTVTVGLGIGYNSTVTEVLGSDDITVNSTTIMPLVRKYWGVSDKFFIFGQAAVPYTFTDGSSTFGVSLSPGIDYFIGGKWTLEATFGNIGYSSTTTEVSGSDDIKSNTINFGFDMMTPKFGIKYLF